MTIKKLMLATAIAVVLTSASYAQDGGADGGAAPAPQPDEDLTQRPLPDGFQGNGSNAEGSWTSRVHSSTSTDGTCVWTVRVDMTYFDGRTDWFEYTTKVPCSENAPHVAGAAPPAIDDQPTYDPPGSGGGTPPVDPPREKPPADPPPAKPLVCPPADWTMLHVNTMNDITYYLKDGTVIRCRDGKIVMVIAPPVKVSQRPEDKKTDYKTAEKPRIDTPKSYSEKNSETKSYALKDDSHSKSYAKIDRSNAKFEGNGEVSTRNVAHEFSETSHGVAHAADMGRLSEPPRGGMHAEGAAGLAKSGHGGITGMRLGGAHLGGLGGLGGMLLGGFGRI